VVECKSYLNSRGVTFAGLCGADAVTGGRYKLFSDDNVKLREVVFSRLKVQLAENGACLPHSKHRLCLACGHIASENDRSRLREHFLANDWELWDEEWLHNYMEQMAESKYVNQVSHIVAKLLRYKNKPNQL
jgi:hypothetical protein